jgi:hypothetical protein
VVTAAPPIPVVPWDTFLSSFVWNLGEHVSLIGSTGKGKTTLAMAILPFRRSVCVWSSKGRDDTIDAFVTDPGRLGLRRPTPDRPYRLITTWPPPPGEHRVVLRPKPPNFDAGRVVRRAEFHECISQVMSPQGGNWCLFVDDTYYLCEMLNMTNDLEEAWAMGRSHGVSIVAATQRPANIPLLAYQATHVFLWRENDDRNLKRLSEIATADTKLVAATVQGLGSHQVLYVNSNTGRMAMTQVRR